MLYDKLQWLLFGFALLVFHYCYIAPQKQCLSAIIIYTAKYWLWLAVPYSCLRIEKNWEFFSQSCFVEKFITCSLTCFNKGV